MGGENAQKQGNWAMENAIGKRNFWGESRLGERRGSLGGVGSSPSTGQQCGAERVLLLQVQQWREAGGRETLFLLPIYMLETPRY